jgi:Family of unknown function (DUF5681)
MSNSRDEENRETNAGPDYAIGNKKPPLHSRFAPGKSGNPSGRPKGRSAFEATVMKEFCKTVSATINGKPIKVTNDKLFVASLVKDGITKGPQSKLLLANLSNGLRLDWRPRPRCGNRPKRRGRSPSSNGPRRNSACTRRFALLPVSNPRLRGPADHDKQRQRLADSSEREKHHGQDRSAIPFTPRVR